MALKPSIAGFHPRRRISAFPRVIGVTDVRPITLQQALARLKQLTEARRRLPRGTPEYASALADEVDFSGVVFDLARTERTDAARR
jgi:hypothetical protein